MIKLEQRQTMNVMLYASVIVLSLVLVYWFVIYKSDTTTFKGKHVTVSLANQTIKAELALTEAQRAKGLMFRNTLPQGSGMFFVFPNQAKHSFWMANTKVPLDIIWLNKDLEIVYISQDTPACTQTGTLKSLCTTYTPTTAAKYVLEVNAGFVKQYSVKTGDKLEIIA